MSAAENYNPYVENNIGPRINNMSVKLRGLSETAKVLLVKAEAVMEKLEKVNPETISPESLRQIIQKVDEYKSSVKERLGELEANTGKIGQAIGQMDSMLSGVLNDVQVTGKAGAVQVANRALYPQGSFTQGSEVNEVK